jgi:hypothetical protein
VRPTPPLAPCIDVIDLRSCPYHSRLRNCFPESMKLPLPLRNVRETLSKGLTIVRISTLSPHHSVQ